MSTFTYDPNLEDDLSKIRTLIQDTDPQLPLLTNQEIGLMVELWGNRGSLYFVASKCCDTIAMKFARETSFSSDSQSVSLSELMGKYQQMSSLLLANDNAMGVGEIFVGGEGGPDSRGPLFKVGMHDDPEAGPQVASVGVFPHPEQWGTNIP